MSAEADSHDERKAQAARPRSKVGNSQVRLAPHKLRLLAFLIDVFFFVSVVGIGFVAGKFYGWLAWVLWVAAAVTFVYYVATTVWLMDQTLGKAMAGLRIRRIDGSAPPRSLRGLAWSVGRHTAGYLIADVLLLGTVAAFFTPGRRCPHDYAFGSEVVLVPRAERAWSHGMQYQEYWELFSTRYEEIQAQYRWFFWPWKWLIRIMSAVGALLSPLMAKEASAAAHSPAATTAKPLSLAGKAALWAGTAVATGATVTALVAPSSTPDPKENAQAVQGIDTCRVLSRRELTKILRPFYPEGLSEARRFSRTRDASTCRWRWTGIVSVQVSESDEDLAELAKSGDFRPLKGLGVEAVVTTKRRDRLLPDPTNTVIWFRKHSTVIAVNVLGYNSQPSPKESRLDNKAAREIAQLVARRL